MNNPKKLLVIALGGNALLKRGQHLNYSCMKQNILMVAKKIAIISKDYKIVIVNGNGPQVGLLALQNNAYKEVESYPFDVLNAESQGMIGYPLQQALINCLQKRPAITLITQSLINPQDQAFKLPNKFIGPLYNHEESKNLIDKNGWQMKKDGQSWRRVVASPKPIDILEIEAISKLVDENIIVIAGGGGGIACVKKDDIIEGIEAVIDKDYTASLIAKKLDADRFVILTDVEGIYEKFDTPTKKLIRDITASNLKNYFFPAGSMLPKVEAVCDFVISTKKTANIGALENLLEIIENKSGTLIRSSRPDA